MESDLCAKVEGSKLDARCREMRLTGEWLVGASQNEKGPLEEADF